MRNITDQSQPNPTIRPDGPPCTYDSTYVHVEVLCLLPVVLLLEQQRVRVPPHVRVGQCQRRLEVIINYVIKLILDS